MTRSSYVVARIQDWEAPAEAKGPHRRVHTPSQDPHVPNQASLDSRESVHARVVRAGARGGIRPAGIHARSIARAWTEAAGPVELAKLEA